MDDALYRDLKERGIECLRDLVEQSRVEDMFLEYKRVAREDYRDARQLDDNDRRNLQKAISSFGNSEGGIVIWGIESQRNTGAATAHRPFKGADRFTSLCNSNFGRLTIPAHNLVSAFSIDDEQNESWGYAVTAIPRFEGLPLQVVEDGIFYIRAGETSMRMPHSIMAAMFGRRPSPMLKIESLKLRHSVFTQRISLHGPIIIRNIGKGIARDSYVNFSFNTKAPNIRIDFSPLSETWAIEKAHSNIADMICSPDLRLGPGQRSRVSSMDLILEPPFEDGLIMQILAGADGQPPISKTYKRTAKEIGEMYEAARKDKQYPLGQHFITDTD